MPNSFGLSSRPLASLLFSALLVALAGVPVAAQDVPADGLLLRLQADALEAAEVPPELAALATDLQHPMPYTAAVIHPHNGRMSVTISQGTLKEGDAPSRFLNDEAAEFFFYDRVLDEQEREALHRYMAASYNAPKADGSDGLNQGIHVQGSWSIEVRDSDGTLSEGRHFENALADARTISVLVAGDSTAGDMEVWASGDLDQHVCVDDEGGAFPCVLQETDANDNYEFATLTVDVPTTFDEEDEENVNAIVLNGNFTAQRNGNIADISTAVNFCHTGTTPNECGQESARDLTAKEIEPISIQEGQVVNIEVVISFN